MTPDGIDALEKMVERLTDENVCLSAKLSECEVNAAGYCRERDDYRALSMRLRRERDALLAAAKEAIAWCDSVVSDMPPRHTYPLTSSDLSMLDAAVAACEGK